MNKSLVIASALVACGFTTALAQDLNTEITVSHEVVPEEQAATRLRVLPQISLPAITAGKLPLASNVTMNLNEITPFISTLEPAPYLNTLKQSPYRGYANIGYSPIYHLAASAGYRIVQRDSLTADIFGQFNGYSYKTGYPDNYYDGKVRLHRNTGLVGGRTSWTAKGGTLNAGLLYDFSSYNFPLMNNIRSMETRILASLAKVNADWNGHVGKVDYNIGMKYNLMAFGGDTKAHYNEGDVHGSILWHYGQKSAWGLDLCWDPSSNWQNVTKGVIHAEPYYMLTWDKVFAHIGVNLDFRTGNQDYDYSGYIAPRVEIGWQPSPYFNIWGKFNGRMVSNSRSSFYDMQPYLDPDYYGGYSRILNCDGGITLGPWKGAWLSAFGGYTWTNDWLIPAMKPGTMHGVDIDGAHAGVELGYIYSKWLQTNVKFEWAQSDNDSYATGYAPWRDHARYNLTAAFTARPIDPLEITLSYHLRTNRSKVANSADPRTPNGRQNLRNISNLSLGAQYAITNQWNVMLRGENLLNRHWYLGPAIPSDGIMVMAGVGYKF